MIMLPLIAFDTQTILDFGRRTCHLEILFDNEGFLKISLIGTSFAISQVMWYNMYCLSLLVRPGNSGHDTNTNLTRHEKITKTRHNTDKKINMTWRHEYFKIA